MTSAEIQLKRIQDKLQLLLKTHTAVQKENAVLKEELQAIRYWIDQSIIRDFLEEMGEA